VLGHAAVSRRNGGTATTRRSRASARVKCCAAGLPIDLVGNS
jgi:hypothetical protein